MIYFVQPVGGGPIKIGYTNDLKTRVRTLEMYYGRKLVVLATMEGGPEEERATHRRFDRLRFRGTEQFRPDPELLEYIGRPFLAKSDPDLVRPMPGTPVKFNRVLANKAKLIAAHRGVSVGEFLSELLRGPLADAYAQMIREIEAEKVTTT